MEQEHVSVFHSEISAAGFVQLPTVVLRDSRLSDGAKLTYCTLLWYAREKKKCFPGQDRLALDRDVTRQTLSNHLQQLAEVGLVSVHRQSFGKTNLYVIRNEHEAYGQEGNWNKLSEKAKDACRLDDNGQPEKPIRRAANADRQLQAACAIGDGIRKAEDGKEKLKKKREKKVKENIQQAGRQKSTTKASRKSVSVPELERRWETVFCHAMNVPVVERWNLKEKKFVKEMLATYGEKRFQLAIEYLFDNWDSLVGRLRIKEAPSIQVMYRIRKTLFLEAETGKVIGGKSRREKLNEDEYDEEAAGKAPKVGWE